MRVQGARGGDGERPHQVLSCEVRASEDVVASICQEASAERRGSDSRGVNGRPLHAMGNGPSL